MKDWKIICKTEIIDKPTETDFKKLGASLFTAHPFCFCWNNNILFSYSNHRESFYNEGEKEIIHIHFIYNIDYIKNTQYKKFIELKLNTADVQLTERADEEGTAIYFPIEKVAGNHHDAIMEKIKEIKK